MSVYKLNQMTQRDWRNLIHLGLKDCYPQQRAEMNKIWQDEFRQYEAGVPGTDDKNVAMKAALQYIVDREWVCDSDSDSVRQWMNEFIVVAKKGLAGEKI